MSLLDVPTRTIPVELAYKRARYQEHHAGRVSNGIVALRTLPDIGLQFLLPATAIVQEHLVNRRSPLHTVMEGSKKPFVWAGATDLIGLAAAFALAPHMPQLHLQVPLTNWDIPAEVTAFVEAKLATNFITNTMWGVAETDLKVSNRRR